VTPSPTPSTPSARPLLPSMSSTLSRDKDVSHLRIIRYLIHPLTIPLRYPLRFRWLNASIPCPRLFFFLTLHGFHECRVEPSHASASHISWRCLRLLLLLYHREWDRRVDHLGKPCCTIKRLWGVLRAIECNDIHNFNTWLFVSP